jgi:AbiEi antitoxin C-terminal domain
VHQPQRKGTEGRPQTTHHARCDAEPGLNAVTERKVQSRPDGCIARRASDEWGVLSLEELRECGLSDGAVRARANGGWLHRIYRQVYAVGHPGISIEGRFLAAVKSLGRDALLSHFAASAHWGFVDWDGRHPEVTVPRQGIARRKGIRVHCTSVLEPRDVMRHKGIPVTSPARTLVDLAAVASEKLLRTAVRRALAQRRVSVRQLLATRRRLGSRRGSARLNRVLMTAAPTRSELEDVVLDLIVDAGFVRPDVNKPLLLAGRRVVPDFRWPEQRVVVEADSRTWHDNPVARQDDVERQALLEAHGDRVLPVTWRQAVARGRETVARIALAGVPRAGAALGASPAPLTGSAPRYPQPP